MIKIPVCSREVNTARTCYSNLGLCCISLVMYALCGKMAKQVLGSLWFDPNEYLGIKHSAHVPSVESRSFNIQDKWNSYTHWTIKDLNTMFEHFSTIYLNETLADFFCKFNTLFVMYTFQHLFCLIIDNYISACVRFSW
jgi:hypothetical protein